ncbi:MAG TPA: ABC transporter permease [Candidatus Competibacteraceae bacterium]|nr:ABC transporter permease [Candidatus Competibacteraceae bacterium]
MALPTYASPLERAWYYGYRVLCALIFLFLIAPILVIIPLSFNAQPYFTFSPEMLTLDPDGYSLRWYREFFNNPAWIGSFKNSFIIATSATLLSTVLGTTAALGLARREMPYKNVIMGLLISPMIAPVIIAAAGMYFFYARFGLTQTFLGIILAHTALGTPFVVITVTATLVGFDRNLIRAAASLGASGLRTFFQVIMPLIAPGVISGALFAFITSFDEVVLVLFLAGAEQRTVTVQMWGGIRENISPTILAVATILIVISVLLLVTMELLRRRNARLRGIKET